MREAADEGLTLLFSLLFHLPPRSFARRRQRRPHRHGVPLKSFDLLGVQRSFGPLEWRGGLELKSTDKRFGGFSSLALSADGEKLLAVSDTGNWFRATSLYKNGRLAGLSDPEIAPLLDKSGKPFKGKSWSDAEALSRLAAWQDRRQGHRRLRNPHPRRRL